MLLLLVNRLLCWWMGHCWISVARGFPVHQCIHCWRAIGLADAERPQRGNRTAGRYFAAAKSKLSFDSSSRSTASFCTQSRVSGPDSLSSNPNDFEFISRAARTNRPSAAIKRIRSVSDSGSITTP